MTAKRFFNDNPCTENDQPPEKRVKIRLASVIREVVMANSMKHFWKAIEPMLRRVVHEEVQRGLRCRTRSIARSSSLQLQAEEPSALKLKFSSSLSLPIFTGTKIVNQDGSPLQILLVETRGSPVALAMLPDPIKIEIVVLDGDFPSGNRNDWTSEEFNRSVVHARPGKRPLLAGDLSLIMRSNSTLSIGELELTDNSSWIRSRRFRLGVRVSPGSNRGVRISEAMTEAFIVKDHRGELYKKHHPPSLNDEVWRLEKIGKEGAFHRKLAGANINTVQDLLKLSVVDPSRLRKILGHGMSEKMWEVTIKHARKCELGKNQYIYRGHNFCIVLNPICQVERAFIDGKLYCARELSNINKPYIQNLVRHAYSNWDLLEETEGIIMDEAPQLARGEMDESVPNYQMARVSSENTFDGSDNWHMAPEFVSTMVEKYEIGYNVTEAFP